MYLEHIAGQYSFALTPEQISLIGMLGLIAMAAVVVFDLAKKLKPPKKWSDDESAGLVRCRKGFYHPKTGSSGCGNGMN